MSVVWLINQYGVRNTINPFHRHNEIAGLLAEKGHEVTVFCSASHHLNKSLDVFTDKPASKFKTHLIPTISYKSSTSKRRVIAWFVFAWKLFRLDLENFRTPDLILISSPSPISYLGAEWLARATGAKLIFEFRDIWPASLVQVGRIHPLHPFVVFLSWIEKRALSNSRYIFSTLEGGAEYVESRIGRPCDHTWAPNSCRTYNKRNSLVSLKDIDPEPPIPEGIFVAGYAGSMGEANAVDHIIDAAILMRARKDILFVLMGTGSTESYLKKKAAEHNLKNVLFLAQLPIEKARIVIERFNVALLCWKDLEIYDYGTSANKLCSYLEARVPIVQSFSGGFDRVANMGLGVSVKSNDPQAFANAIIRVKHMSASSIKGIKRNIDKAVKLYSYKNTVKAIEGILED